MPSFLPDSYRFFIYFCWPCHEACVILVPHAGIEHFDCIVLPIAHTKRVSQGLQLLQWDDKEPKETIQLPQNSTTLLGGPT